MASSEPKKRRWLTRKTLFIAGGVLALILVCVAIEMVLQGVVASQASLANSGWQTVEAKTGSIEATVSATGNIKAKAEVELRFTGDGTVTKILVKPGDKVKSGQILAQIDDTQLQLNLASAEAELRQAQLEREDLLDGASPAEVAAAKARVAQAQGQFQQAVGSVTPAHITAARARLEQAQAELAQLQSGPKSTELQVAEAQLREAQTNLEAERNRLSAAKTNAKLDLDKAVDSLTQAQIAYAPAAENWRHVQETGKIPGYDFEVSPEQRREYHDAFVKAEATLHSAEAAVQQAQVTYDNARQAEVTGIQAAEQRVAQQQANLDKLLSAPDRDKLAAAHAAVANAQAELARLTGADRSGSVSAAQAGIRIAEADLDKLIADPSASALAKTEAAVARAEVAVKKAQYELDRAFLKAPFDATVARVDLQVGQKIDQNGLVVVVDLSSFHIDVPVDELDVSQLARGQQVHVTLDALPGKQIGGTVTNIEPLATKNAQGATTYQVRVEISQEDPAILPGMTAAVQIVTTAKDNAILVPRRAIQTRDGKTYLLIPTSGQFDVQNNRPASEERPVTVGLSNNEYIEITSGLKAGEQVLVPDVVRTLNPFSAQS